ncbi:MFS-type transporter SLC18B1 [Nymphon striatum]|nr:MFS-type transporter SLC18B1 [Nymphon striatum]
MATEETDHLIIPVVTLANAIGINDEPQKAKNIKFTSDEKIIVLVLTAINLLCSMIFGTLSVFYTVVASKRGIEEFEVGFVYASFYASAVLFSPTSGKVACVEIGVTTGYGFGALIGGYLFDKGGFFLPHVVLAILFAVFLPISFFTLPDLSQKETHQHSTDKQENSYSFLQLLLVNYKNPSILCPILATFSIFWQFAFNVTAMPPYLSSFGISKTRTGQILMSGNIVYGLVGIPIGLLIDKFDCGIQMLIIGSIARFFTFGLLGPYPFYGFTRKLWLQPLGMGIGGLCVSLMYVPCLDYFLKEARYNGLSNNLETNAMLSTIITICTGLGQTLGPIAADIEVQYLGFPWASVLTGSFCLFNATISIGNVIWKRSIHRKLEEDSTNYGEWESAYDPIGFILRYIIIGYLYYKAQTLLLLSIIGSKCHIFFQKPPWEYKSGYKGETADRILSFHKFPLKDPELIQRWLRRLQRKNFVPTENSRLCSLHFDDSSFVLQTTDKNKKRAGARDFSQLSKRRLVINAVPSIFPNCPSYMKSEFTNECSASRGKSATIEGRQDRMNSQLQENIQNFWSEDSIKSIEDVYQKLEAQSGYIPIGFTWILQSEKLLILSIVWNDGVPHIVGSITLCSSLSISITVNGGIVAPQKFKHITSKEKLENFDTLRNLMAAVKNWIVISETDCSELLDKAKDSLEKYIDKCEGIEKQKQCGFLREQIGLLESSKKSRRYSPDCLISSYLLYAASPNAYEEFRKQNLLCLPSSRTLRSLTSIIKANESKYLKSRFSNLNSYERHVILMIDEIYTASRVEYSSSEGKIIGLTTDNNVAGTILTFMISSIAGQYRDVVSFYPINGINAKKLHVSCLEVLKYLDEIGFNVTVLCVDNHPVNRAFLTNILCNGSLKSQIKNPVNDKPLFLLFDPVHNIKNVYNNFQGKRIFKLPSFHLDNLNFVTTAKFDDLCELHNLEATKPIKLGYKLTEKCLNPTSIEKSSVKLSMSVFNESTENALIFYSDHENKDWIGTATFISHFLKLWSIINVKNKSVGKFKRDPYREPIMTVTDGRLTYLYDFANFLKIWQQNKNFCLTKVTFTVMHHMCVTLPQIACYFLDVLKFQYVLFGKFQSDMIESRFGWYRQLSGGNYFISVKQVLESERKIKAVSLLKFSGLNALDDFDKHDCVQLSENEVECFVLQMQDYEMAKLDSGDMNAIYYVAGALVRSMLKRTNCVSCKIFLVDDKRSNIDELAADKFEIVNDDVKHFVEAVNRGGLLAPSSLAFDISALKSGFFLYVVSLTRVKLSPDKYMLDFFKSCRKACWLSESGYLCPFMYTVTVQTT